MRDDGDDLEFQLWCEATDKERDAEFARLEAKYIAWRDSLTPQQEYRVDRGSLLRAIRDNRRRLRDPTLARIEVIDELWRQHIRRNQVRLLELRTWRATGVYPGSA